MPQKRTESEMPLREKKKKNIPAEAKSKKKTQPPKEKCIGTTSQYWRGIENGDSAWGGKAQRQSFSCEKGRRHAGGRKRREGSKVSPHPGVTWGKKKRSRTSGQVEKVNERRTGHEHQSKTRKATRPRATITLFPAVASESWLRPPPKMSDKVEVWT